jgi:hypothetical protein
MNQPNNTYFSKILNPIIPMIEKCGVGIFASNAVWCIVLGVLPKGEEERDKKIMKKSCNDSTENKVDNINRITELAKLITQRPDYSNSNLTDFTYAIRQLIRYAMGDEIAYSSLTNIKGIYISFVAAYFHESMTIGKRQEALDTLKYFGEEILKEDEEMKTKLAEIRTYKMLS